MSTGDFPEWDSGWRAEGWQWRADESWFSDLLGYGRVTRNSESSEDLPHRFYSLAAQIRIQRQEYYGSLETTQRATSISHLGCFGSACESFPTVFQFFEHVKFPKGIDARGFQTACIELARRISVAERTQENAHWPRVDAEKLWGNLELLVNSNKLKDQPFGIPVTHSGLSSGNRGVAPEDLLAFLKEQILWIYGRRISTPSKASPHRDLFAVLNEILPADAPIAAYTTNYDTVVEDLFRSPSACPDNPRGLGPVCTGFEKSNPGRWNPELFDAPPDLNTRQLNLYKLHGSVTWKWESTESGLEPVEMNWRHPLRGHSNPANEGHLKTGQR
jgi:hypothetical protein